jgi:hypothetical protein
VRSSAAVEDIDEGADFLAEYASAKVNRAAEEFLLRDGRFQRPDGATKRAVLQVLGLRPDGPWSHQAFDLVRTSEPAEPVTPSNVAEHAATLELVEVKGTRATNIADAALSRFFFGATATQFALAQALPQRFRWGFVVLSADNTYGRPFYVLLTPADVEERVLRARVQYQIDFRRDLQAAALKNATPVFLQGADSPAGLAAETGPVPSERPETPSVDDQLRAR